MSKTELQNIERFEDREKQFGITIKGLFAVIDDDEYGINLSVRGEVHAVDASKMPEIMKVVVAALSQDGKIMGTDSDSYYSENFMGFASLDCSLHDLIKRPTSVRIYPEKVY